MVTLSDDPVLDIERRSPGEKVDPAGFDATLLQRMQAYGYLTEDNVRNSSRQRLAHAWGAEGLVLFLGAGVSSASGIPGWRALLDALLADVSIFPADSAAGHGKGSASLLLQTGAGLPMTSQFDLIVHDCKGPRAKKEKEFIDRLRATLYGNERFTRLRVLLDDIPEEEEAKRRHDWKPLQQALSANGTLAALGDLIMHGLARTRAAAPRVHAVLTTNVDNLLQAYVTSKMGGKRRLDTISDPSAAQKPGNVPVYHLHGWLDMRVQREHGAVREPPLVFRESEYFGTIARPNSFANNTAQHYFRRNRVLFIGTSLEDLDVRRWRFNAFEERQLAHLGRLESRFPSHAAAASEAYAASIRHFWLKCESDLPEPRTLMKDFLEDAMRHLGVEILCWLALRAASRAEPRRSARQRPSLPCPSSTDAARCRGGLFRSGPAGVGVLSWEHFPLRCAGAGKCDCGEPNKGAIIA